MGTCNPMSNCQICAAVPSSGSRTAPYSAMWQSTTDNAANDMKNGMKALGRLTIRARERCEFTLQPPSDQNLLAQGDYYPNFAFQPNIITACHEVQAPLGSKSLGINMI